MEVAPGHAETRCPRVMRPLPRINPAGYHPRRPHSRVSRHPQYSRDPFPSTTAGVLTQRLHAPLAWTAGPPTAPLTPPAALAAGSATPPNFPSRPCKQVLAMWIREFLRRAQDLLSHIDSAWIVSLVDLSDHPPRMMRCGRQQLPSSFTFCVRHLFAVDLQIVQSCNALSMRSLLALCSFLRESASSSILVSIIAWR